METRSREVDHARRAERLGVAFGFVAAMTAGFVFAVMVIVWATLFAAYLDFPLR